MPVETILIPVWVTSGTSSSFIFVKLTEKNNVLGVDADGAVTVDTSGQEYNAFCIK
jgi:hypothetical protein